MSQELVIIGGGRYGAEKDVTADALLARIDSCLPGTRAAVRMTDVVTPLTFWRNARSWRGAFEGWMPSPEAFFGHIDKSLPGLDGFLMAGQWVEPGLSGVTRVCRKPDSDAA